MLFEVRIDVNIIFGLESSAKEACGASGGWDVLFLVLGPAAGAYLLHENSLSLLTTCAFFCL